jgi:hypothetical protein
MSCRRVVASRAIHDLPARRREPGHPWLSARRCEPGRTNRPSHTQSVTSGTAARLAVHARPRRNAAVAGRRSTAPEAVQRSIVRRTSLGEESLPDLLADCPADVIDPMLWNDAQLILRRHFAPAGSDSCSWCSGYWPCAPAQLAMRAETAARRSGRDSLLLRNSNASRFTPRSPGHASGVPEQRPPLTESAGISRGRAAALAIAFGDAHAGALAVGDAATAAAINDPLSADWTPPRDPSEIGNTVVRTGAVVRTRPAAEVYGAPPPATRAAVGRASLNHRQYEWT